MSWRTISIDELDKQMPVKPPTVNWKINPIDHNIDKVYLIFDPYILANHLNTLIPVGIAIIIVAAVKYARVSTSIPTVNIWCAHTIKPITAILIIA